MKHDEQPADQDLEERIEDVEVRLKPIFGIDPPTYVPIVWGVLLLVALFLVLVLPGLRNHGTMLTVISSPARGSVVVDDVRLGTSPGTFFVASGTRTLEVRRPGFEPSVQTIEVRGRLIGSWIVPRRKTVRVMLSGADPDALVRSATAEFAAWSLTGEASGQYQFPPVARVLADDLWAVAGMEEGRRPVEAPSALPRVRDAWERFVEAALPQVASEALLNDLVAGSLAMGGESPVAVASGIASTVAQLARISAEAPLVPLQIANTLAAEREAVVAESTWAEAGVRRAQELSAIRFEGSSVLAGGARTYALGLRFVELPGGTVVLGGAERAARGGDVPWRTEIAPYSVSLTEVPASAWIAFLEENPMWRPEERATLVEGGLVDEHYLADYATLAEQPDLPVTGVSAYAAEAFAAWYSEQLPGDLVARLPTEAEWEYALAVSGADDGVFSDVPGGPVAVAEAGGARAGLSGLLGNVWEWTADTFAPYGHVYASASTGGVTRDTGTLLDAGTATGPSPQRVVRGGGWATEPVGFDPGDRGSMDPTWCSPFVGFRLVVSSPAE
ncbi:MAG: SUMF1/EgtB/PvdO family nonheme iron enzyme [Spirochaetota bacterium]